MAAGTAIGKIGKIDFFACLPSGAYAFLCLYLAISIVVGLEDTERVADDGKVAISVKAADSENTVDFNVIVDSRKIDNTQNDDDKNDGLWNAINQLIKKTSKEPTSLLLIIFSAYLLGSIFRAIPVKYTDFLFNFKDFEFPSKEVIKAQIQDVGGHYGISQVNAERLPSTDKLAEQTSSEKKVPLLTIYNYWKDELCINSPEGFAYYQEFEARTRFFSGMLCSGLFGIMIVFLALLKMGYQKGFEFWSLFFFCIFSLITILIVINHLYSINKGLANNKELQSKLKKTLRVIFSLLICITGFILWYAREESWSGDIDLLILFISSGLIAIIFGLNIMQIRLQETQVLTGLYLAYKQKN